MLKRNLPRLCLTMISLLSLSTLTSCGTTENNAQSDSKPFLQAIREHFGNTSTPGIANYTAITNTQTQQEDIDTYNNAGDLWKVLGEQFKLGNNEDNPLVQIQIEKWLQNKATLTAMIQRAQPYLYYIYVQAKKRHLPVELTLLPIIESGYNPLMCSDAGACGLWQIMPGTASGLYVNLDWWYDGRRDIIQSTNAALNYMGDLQREFNGNWLLAIAAYDTGPGTVDNAIRRTGKNAADVDFWDLKLSEETETYVPKLLALAAIISDPERYGITLPPVKDATYLAQVTLHQQIDLPLGAHYAGLSLPEFDRLNPGFNRWATDPHGDTTLLIPITKTLEFERNIEAYNRKPHVTWQRYTVRRGESLNAIARKFRTSVPLIKQLNNLQGDEAPLNKPLIIAEDEKTLPVSDLSLVQQYMAVNNQLPGQKMSTHEVRPGETLWSIAREYRTKIADLRYWNHLGAGEDAKPYSHLIIWSTRRSGGETTINHEYMVRRGDTLSSIASEFNTTIDELKRANDLKDDTINLGETLTVATVANSNPSGAYQVKLAGSDLKSTLHYTVKRGDDLYKIAQRFHVPVEDIIAWNDIRDDQVLRLGQSLVIEAKSPG